MFLIDAATGGDALIYDETQPVPCGGTGVVPAGVAVPIEETLGILDSGTTITMHVGDVLAPPGLFPGQDPSTAQPARSSDPAVLGSLGIPGQGPFAQFRAWQPGRATLTIPDRTWLVYVTVLARS